MTNYLASHKNVIIAVILVAICGESGLSVARRPDIDPPEPRTPRSRPSVRRTDLPEFPEQVYPVKLRSMSGATAKCLATQNGGNQLDARVMGEVCDDNKKYQDWFIIPESDGTYQLRAGHFGARLLSIRNASTSEGAAAQTFTWTTAPNMRWQFLQSPNDTSVWMLRNYHSQKCLTADGIQRTCNQNDASMLFSITPKAFPMSVMARHSSKCLNVADATPSAKENNANIQQYPCGGWDNERWSIDPAGSTPGHKWWYVKSSHSGKCLDVAGAELGNNGNVQQFDCVGVNNEKWEIISAGEDFFYFKNLHSGRCMTVAGSSTETHANIDQYDCVNAPNQQWRFVYYISPHVELITTRLSNGTGTLKDSIEPYFGTNFDRARVAFSKFGINLQYDSAVDYLRVNNDALFNYGLKDGLLDCPGAGGQVTPATCVESYVRKYPHKILLVSTGSAGGASSGDANVVQIAGGGYGDTCPLTPENENVNHITHELGHFFGLGHTFPGDGDLLADTPSDQATDSCTHPGVSESLWRNPMTYYYSLEQYFSPVQGKIIRSAAYARFAGALR